MVVVLVVSDEIFVILHFSPFWARAICATQRQIPGAKRRAGSRQARY